MAEKSGPSIAIIALCVSIVSLGFSGYQWWYGKSEARILAAIDITKRPHAAVAHKLTEGNRRNGF